MAEPHIMAKKGSFMLQRRTDSDREIITHETYIK